MINKSGAKARVQLTIEVDAGSCWGNDCTIQQIYDQAGCEGLARVERIFREAKHGVSIVGKPKVVAVISQEV